MARGEKSASVRDGARRLGVSERTVWRWLAAASGEDAEAVLSAREDRRCAYCDEPLPKAATARRRFCDDGCRLYAHRRELAFREFAAIRDARQQSGRH